MRFPLSLGLIATASFAGGYALMRSVEALPQDSASEARANPATASTRPPLAPAAQSSSAPVQDLLAAMVENDDEFTQEHQLFVAIQGLDAAEFRTLFATHEGAERRQQLEKLPADLRFHVLQSLTRRWLELDAPAMLAWLPRAKIDFPGRNGNVHEIIKAVAETRPEKAVEYVSNLPMDEFRESIASALFEQLAAVDPESARAFLRRFPDPAASAAPRYGYRKGLARSDPLAAIAFAKTIPEEPQRTAALQSIGNDLEQQPSAVVAEVCRNLEESYTRRATLQKFAEFDPARAAEAAADLLATPPPNERPYDRQDYVSVAGKEFGRVAPAEAVAWALSLTDDVRSSALEAVSSGWAQINPKEALFYLDALPPETFEAAPRGPAFRQDPRLAAFQEWVRADDTAARIWADALPPGDLRRGAQGALILNLAHIGSRSEELMRELSALAPEEFKAVALEVAQSLAFKDASAAVDWAFQVAQTRQEYEPMEISVEHWFVADPQAAASWVEALPPGPTRDAAAAACARLAISLDAISASSWVAQIADPQRREATAQQVAAEWKKRDAEAAEAWLSRIAPAIGNEARASAAPTR